MAIRIRQMILVLPARLQLSATTTSQFARPKAFCFWKAHLRLMLRSSPKRLTMLIQWGRIRGSAYRPSTDWKVISLSSSRLMKGHQGRLSFAQALARLCGRSFGDGQIRTLATHAIPCRHDRSVSQYRHTARVRTLDETIMDHSGRDDGRAGSFG